MTEDAATWFSSQLASDEVCIKIDLLEGPSNPVSKQDILS